MKSKKKHKILDRVQKKSIRRKIKQISQKRKVWQSDESDDHYDNLSCCHSRDWEHKMQKIILNKKMFNDLRTKPKSKDKKLVHKKHGKDVKEECESTAVVEPIAREPSSITKTRRVGEVRGSPEAPWQLYYDGASVMSRKYAGSGAVLQDLKHHTLDEFARYIGPQSMHVAEYVGLLGGLRLALNWNVDHLCCYGDSRIVHNQVNLQNFHYTRTPLKPHSLY